MNGETDLGTLLLAMEPVLHEGRFVFCTIDRAPTPNEVAAAVAVVREDEGTTLVLAHEDAILLGLTDPLLPDPLRPSPSPLMARITLRVHSSLEAVGLTAAVASALADAAIACNVIAGFHHDHLFVPADRAADAMVALQATSNGH